MKPYETELDPEEAAATAARLVLGVDEAARLISGPVAAITSAHATKPWGTDDAGKKFEEDYLAGADSLLDAPDDVYHAVSVLAEQAGFGALHIRSEDELFGRRMHDLTEDLTGQGDRAAGMFR